MIGVHAGVPATKRQRRVLATTACKSFRLGAFVGAERPAIIGLDWDASMDGLQEHKDYDSGDNE